LPGAGKLPLRPGARKWQGSAAAALPRPPATAADLAHRSRFCLCSGIRKWKKEPYCMFLTMSKDKLEWVADVM